MKTRFLQHVVGGFSIGLFIGAVILLAMIWLVLPDVRHIPLILAAIALFEAGLIGAIAGVVLFLRRIREDDDDDDEASGPPDGHKQPAIRSKPSRPTPSRPRPLPA